MPDLSSIESRYIREIAVPETGSNSPLRRVKDEITRILGRDKGYQTNTEETDDSIVLQVSKGSWRLQLSARIDSNTRYIDGVEQQYTSFLLDGKAGFPGIDKSVAQGEALTFWLKYIFGAAFAIGFIALAHWGLMEGWSVDVQLLAITAGFWFAVGMLVGYITGRLITAIARISASAKAVATTPVDQIEQDLGAARAALDGITEEYQ